MNSNAQSYKTHPEIPDFFTIDVYFKSGRVVKDLKVCGFPFIESMRAKNGQMVAKNYNTYEIMLHDGTIMFVPQLALEAIHTHKDFNIFLEKRSEVK